MELHQRNVAPGTPSRRTTGRGRGRGGRGNNPGSANLEEYGQVSERMEHAAVTRGSNIVAVDLVQKKDGTGPVEVCKKETRTARPRGDLQRGRGRSRKRSDQMLYIPKAMRVGGDKGTLNRPQIPLVDNAGVSSHSKEQFADIESGSAEKTDSNHTSNFAKNTEYCHQNTTDIPSCNEKVALNSKSVDKLSRITYNARNEQRDNMDPAGCICKTSLDNVIQPGTELTNKNKCDSLDSCEQIAKGITQRDVSDSYNNPHESVGELVLSPGCYRSTTATASNPSKQGVCTYVTKHISPEDSTSEHKTVNNKAEDDGECDSSTVMACDVMISSNKIEQKTVKITAVDHASCNVGDSHLDSFIVNDTSNAIFDNGQNKADVTMSHVVVGVKSDIPVVIASHIALTSSVENYQQTVNTVSNKDSLDVAKSDCGTSSVIVASHRGRTFSVENCQQTANTVLNKDYLDVAKSDCGTNSVIVANHKSDTYSDSEQETVNITADCNTNDDVNEHDDDDDDDDDDSVCFTEVLTGQTSSVLSDSKQQCEKRPFDNELLLSSVMTELPCDPGQNTATVLVNQADDEPGFPSDSQQSMNDLISEEKREGKAPCESATETPGSEGICSCSDTTGNSFKTETPCNSCVLKEYKRVEMGNQSTLLTKASGQRFQSRRAEVDLSSADLECDNPCIICGDKAVMASLGGSSDTVVQHDLMLKFSDHCSNSTTGSITKEVCHEVEEKRNEPLSWCGEPESETTFTSAKLDNMEITSKDKNELDSPIQERKKNRKKSEMDVKESKEMKIKSKNKKKEKEKEKKKNSKGNESEKCGESADVLDKTSFGQQEEKKKKKKERSSSKIKKKGEVGSGEKQKGNTRNEKKRSTGDGSDDDWDTLFDDNGECYNPEMLEELSQATGIGVPCVKNPRFDYLSFTPKEIQLDDPDYSHIVEIFDFSQELKTQDLMQALSAFREKGFDIKWVDDTHALGVFASEIAANQAIQMCSGPLLKLRPVSEGSAESKSKARRCCEFLQPYKERPKTTKLTAHRMVTGALGVKSHMTREERSKEREKLKEAREQKRLKEKQKAEAWGD